jgi:hypothetical protein
MNLQRILRPFVDVCQWSFKHLIEPMSHWFNWICIVFAFLAILYWLNRQKKYNQKAIAEGTTI